MKFLYFLVAIILSGFLMRYVGLTLAYLLINKPTEFFARKGWQPLVWLCFAAMWVANLAWFAFIIFLTRVGISSASWWMIPVYAFLGLGATIGAYPMTEENSHSTLALIWVVMFGLSFAVFRHVT